jgi:hypothetical protein
MTNTYNFAEMLLQNNKRKIQSVNKRQQDLEDHSSKLPWCVRILNGSTHNSSNKEIYSHNSFIVCKTNGMTV